jgi:hypothetical protein
MNAKKFLGAFLLLGFFASLVMAGVVMWVLP